MNKKLIIMIAGAGLASFAGAFVFSWFAYKIPVGTPQQTPQTANMSQPGRSPGPDLPEGMAKPKTGLRPAELMTPQQLTEKQLADLLYEVREKIQQYDNKLQNLQKKEKRIQMAQETLKKDIESLNNLRIELASVVASIKNERDKLEKSRVEIAQAEKTNLMSIAATYDRMDSTSASKILTNMCNPQVQKDKTEIFTNGMDDAVKILHYMNERTKGKLLAELVTSEPKLAAVLSQKLKQVIER
jgi:flagellar motility protein MotE (MotC chaperone)